MTIIVQRASDVRIQEINMSQVVTSASTAVGALIVVSKQGRTEIVENTNADDFIFEYGNPDPKVSFTIYAALDFFREGNDLFSKRVVGAGALTAVILMYKDNADGKVKLLAVPDGIADPKRPDWEDLLPNPADQAIGVFYPKQGPGSYAEQRAVSITSTNAQTPTGLVAASSTTGGVMVPGNYKYQIAALTQGADGSTLGETLVSNPVAVVIAGAGTTYSVKLDWQDQPLAWGYRIYGRTDTGSGFMVDLGQGVTTWTDTGALIPDTARQPITNPANLPPANPLFEVNFFDLNESKTYPVEQFNVTLEDGVDGDGSQTEIEDRINSFSRYMGFTSNVLSLTSVPTVDSVARTQMIGGDSGSAVTSFQIAAAWAEFANKEAYKINILINGGYADVNVQQAMISLAELRGDCTAMLDVPSSQQQWQQAINFRRLELNANTTYAGLFNPDVLESDNINGKTQWVPFSGSAAALCARTDRVANPSFSIAGLNRGLLTNVLRSRYTFDDGQASAMFRAQVNYTRTFLGQGIALWEQQTLSTPMSALSWISVRRIVNVIKVALYDFGLYFLQEPNDDFTARGIVNTFSQYLQGVQDARGITSYSVTSSAINNSAIMTGAGIRRVTVIIVPTIPIHELQVQVVVTREGMDFTEILNTVAQQ